MKKCIKCNIPLILNDNWNDYSHKKLHYICKKCISIQKRKYYSKNKKKAKHNNLKKFGITLNDYDKLLKSQNYKCAICKNSETAIHNLSKKVISLAVDHCHISGKVRGLLCGNCNTSLGGFKDNIKYLKSAVKYLNKKEK